MRELERTEKIPSLAPARPLATLRVAVVGQGRMGKLLASRLAEAGLQVGGAFGREGAAGDYDVVLLCVPDSEIASAAARIDGRGDTGPLVGHCSGATGLDLLFPHECFSLHPLMSVTAADTDLRGAGAAVAGSSPLALQTARDLAGLLDLKAIEVAPEDRVAYHAAASIASNFLVTLEAAAERLGASAGIGRDLLAPLALASLENWVSMGAQAALTGPVARRDVATVARQRDAVASRAPELLGLWDELVAATERLAAAGAPA